MFGSIATMRGLIRSGGAIRARILGNMPTPPQMQKKRAHHDGPPQPFDNMPFNVSNRFFATVFFALFFGTGFWAPYIIVWYSMAKRTL